MRRAAAVLFLATVAALGPAGARAVADAPPGATARCTDGTFSFSKTRSGTCSRHRGVANWLVGKGGNATNTAGINVGVTITLTPRTEASGCVRGARPDRRCSPGAYYSGLTSAILCSSTFHTGDVRNVPQSEKSAVERAYGMQARAYGRTIEIDHIVPLELGGSNDISNLFPESGTGAASYHAKDQLENRIHDMLCAGHIRLRAAQTQMGVDWVLLYRGVFGVAPRG